MMTLEDQVRRYAVDVAGPAVAAAPTDLLDLGRPRHRGRWVLVAALVVFIAGLTWVATRPSELSEQPSVDTLPTSVTMPPDVVARPIGTGACADGSPIGVVLDGTAGSGLCMTAEWMQTSPELAPTEPLMAVVYLDGVPLGASGVQGCGPITWGGSVGPGWISGPELLVVYAQVPVESATARVVGGDGSTLVAFDLPGVERSRFVVARAPDESWTRGLEVFDAAGRPIDSPPEGGRSCDSITRASAE